MRGRRGGGRGGRGCGAGGSGPGGGRRRRGTEERGTGGGGGVGGGGGWAASPGATNAEARPHPPANRPSPLPGSLCGSRHRCARSLGPPRRHLPPIRAAAHREDRRRGDRRGGVMHQQIQHGAGGAPGVEGAAAAETGHGWRAPRAFVCTAAAADTRPRRRREAAAACDTQSSPPPPPVGGPLRAARARLPHGSLTRAGLQRAWDAACRPRRRRSPAWRWRGPRREPRLGAVGAPPLPRRLSTSNSDPCPPTAQADCLG